MRPPKHLPGFPQPTLGTNMKDPQRFSQSFAGERRFSFGIKSTEKDVGEVRACNMDT